MKLNITMKLNPSTDIKAEFESADIQDAIRSAGIMLDFDGKCGFCDSTDITLQTRITKDEHLKFTEYVCRKCGARRSWGKYKDGTGFFLKGWEPKYEGGANAQ